MNVRRGFKRLVLVLGVLYYLVGLPAVRFLILRGRFLVNRGRRSNRRMILGADRATHQCEEEGSRKQGRGYVLTNDVKENTRSYLVRPLSKRNQMRRSVSSIQ